MHTFLIIFVTIGILLLPYQGKADNTTQSEFTIDLAFDLGIPDLEIIGEANGFIIAYSSVSSDFYLFGKSTNEWKLIETFEENVSLPQHAEFIRLSNEKLALVTLQGYFLVFTVDDQGNMGITSSKLSDIDNPFRPDREEYTLEPTYDFINGQLIVVAGLPNKSVHVYDLANGFVNPRLISKTALPEDIEFISSITANQDSIWIVSRNAIYYLNKHDDSYSLVDELSSPDNQSFLFSPINATDELLIISRSNGGFYYADLLTEPTKLHVSLTTDFPRQENTVEIESVNGITHYRDSLYFFSYSSGVVITDLTLPSAPEWINSWYIAGLNQLFLNNQKITIASSRFGFVQTEIDDLYAPPSFEVYDKELFYFSAINVVDDQVIASRFRNDGLIRFEGTDILALADGEIENLDESRKLEWQSPRCFDSNDSYIYGIGYFAWQMPIDYHGLILSAENTSLPPAGINSNDCLIYSNSFFATGSDRSIWYVDLQNFHDENYFERIDLSSVFVSQNSSVNHLLLKDDYLIAANTNSIALLKQYNNGEWLLLDSFNLIDVSQAYVYSEGFVNIIDIDLWGDIIIVSDAASGHVFEMNIENDTLVFKAAFGAAPNDSEFRPFGLIDTVIYENTLITNGWDKFSIFVRDETSSSVRVVDIPHDRKVSDITLFKNLLLGGTESFRAYRIMGCESDTDADGKLDCIDSDDDNDGTNDDEDALPLDPSETVDTDGDGVGNNTDSDDDNDNVSDIEDAFPLDASEYLDTDGDGIGNNADTDDDNDGTLDPNDTFPLDMNESLDTDGDGIGNNADADDDNDGVTDVDDAFPLDPNKSANTPSPPPTVSSSSSGGAIHWIVIMIGILTFRLRAMEKRQ